MLARNKSICSFARGAIGFFVNVGDRNAAHDRFVIAEVDKLGELGAHFDLLAIPAKSCAAFENRVFMSSQWLMRLEAGHSNFW